MATDAQSPTTPTFGNHAFDIVAAFQHAKQLEPTLPDGLAAVLGLTKAVESVELSTLAETMTMLGDLSKRLKAKMPNSLGFGTGIDAFLKYIETPWSGENDTTSDNSRGDFEVTRGDIVEAGHDFVEQGKKAEGRIVNQMHRFMGNNVALVIPSYSPIIEKTLRRIAEDTIFEFRVLFVEPTPGHQNLRAQQNLASELKDHGIATATIPPNALARALFGDLRPVSDYDIIIITSATAISRDGGALAPLGTLNAAAMAGAAMAQVVVMSEKFRLTNAITNGASGLGNPVAYFTDSSFTISLDRDMSKDCMDYVPPNLIDVIVTEEGPMNPPQVAEEAFKKWG